MFPPLALSNMHVHLYAVWQCVTTNDVVDNAIQFRVGLSKSENGGRGGRNCAREGVRKRERYRCNLGKEFNIKWVRAVGGIESYMVGALVSGCEGTEFEVDFVSVSSTSSNKASRSSHMVGLLGRERQVVRKEGSRGKDGVKASKYIS